MEKEKIKDGLQHSYSILELLGVKFSFRKIFCMRTKS